MERVILHSDCNSFYASCESIIDPELKKVPMAVCGDPENRHGIILAKNELAKRYNIKTAETVYQAKRKCPQLVLVRAHHDFYEQISEKCNAIYREYTDLVEPFGIDESWLDVTASRLLFGNGQDIANQLRQRFKEEIGITCSVGVSFNKPFAKLGSDYKKPDAVTVISRENFKQIVWPMPVSALLFAGKNVTEALKKRGIYTIGDLALADEAAVTSYIGKIGTQLHSYACGLDDAPVESIYAVRTVKSVSNGRTFGRDLTTREEIKAGVMMLSETVAMRLRACKLKCTVMYVQVKYADFTVVARQKSLDYSTNLMRDIWSVCLELLFGVYNGKPVRAITVGTTGLISSEQSFEQLSLFENVSRRKQEGLEDAVDKIRRKYGKGSVGILGLMDKDE